MLTTKKFKIIFLFFVNDPSPYYEGEVKARGAMVVAIMTGRDNYFLSLIFFQLEMN